MLKKADLASASNSRAAPNNAAIRSGLPGMTQLAAKPGASQRPVIIDRSGRRAHDFRNFLKAQTAEVPHLHNAKLARIQNTKSRQSLVQYQSVMDGRHGTANLFIVEFQHCRADIAFLAMPAPGPIHQDSAHHFGSSAKKVRPALPVPMPLRNQTEKGIMHQGSSLHESNRFVSPQARGGHLAQFRVQPLNQISERRPVSALDPANSSERSSSGIQLRSIHIFRSCLRVFETNCAMYLRGRFSRAV